MKIRSVVQEDSEGNETIMTHFENVWYNIKHFNILLYVFYLRYPERKFNL